MISDREARARFDTISDMAAKITDLERDLADMTSARAAHKARADRAESQVRQLEQQITSPVREVKTLYAHVDLVADREKLDADMAKLLSAGWEKFDSGVIPGAEPMRFVSFSRVAPLPSVEPEKPTAATETVIAETTPSPAPQPVPTVKPSLTVQRRSTLPSESEFQADLGIALKSTLDHIRRTNPFFGYQPRTFGEIMEAHHQS